MATTSTPKAGSFLDSLEVKLDQALVKNAPFQLPTSVKEWIVTYSPWISLVLLILALPALLAAFSVSLFVSSWAPAVGATLGVFFWIGWVFLVFQIVLLAMAIPRLMRRERKGWKLIFYSALVSVVYSVFNWVDAPAAVGGLLFTLLFVVIEFYFIFQIRSYYK